MDRVRLVACSQHWIDILAKLGQPVARERIWKISLFFHMYVLKVEPVARALKHVLDGRIRNKHTAVAETQRLSDLWRHLVYFVFCSVFQYIYTASIVDSDFNFTGWIHADIFGV